MIEILALIFLLLFVFYYYRSRNVNYWSDQGIPTAPNCHWLFGHYKPIILAQKNNGTLFQDIYDKFPEEPVVGYLKMAVPGLLVKDPDLIRAILSTDYNSFNKNYLTEKVLTFKNWTRKFPEEPVVGYLKMAVPGLLVKDPDLIHAILSTDYNSFNKNYLTVDKDVDFLFGHNAFVKQGDEWKAARGHMSPMVTFAKLKIYLPKALELGDELVKYISTNCNQQQTVEFDGKILLGMFTTDVVANVICGIQNNTFTDKDSVFTTITREIFQSSFIDNLKNLTIFVFPEISHVVKVKFASNRTQKLMLELTQKMMKERAQYGDKTAHDFFQQMITFRRNDKIGVLTDKYIASHLYGFILDSYETSSLTVSFTLFELAWNSEEQEKLRSEILEMISRTNGEYTVEDIEGLKYLDMVVNEGLRMHAPLMVMAKECTTDYPITHAKLKKPLIVKKGTPISIPVCALHSDEKYYKSPMKFNPDRFSEGEVAGRHKFVYMPFGEGPRTCPGQRFGMLMSKISIIKILQHFRVQPSAKAKYPVEEDPKVFMLKRALNGTFKKL